MTDFTHVTIKKEIPSRTAIEKFLSKYCEKIEMEKVSTPTNSEDAKREGGRLLLKVR